MKGELSPALIEIVHTLPDLMSLLGCRQDICIVPVLVGSLTQANEKRFGALLAPYLAREDTFTVVSSDFCHWCVAGSQSHPHVTFLLVCRGLTTCRLVFLLCVAGGPASAIPSITLHDRRSPNLSNRYA